MGNVDSVEEEFLPELKKMKLILDKGFYRVYESSDNNKYDFWFLKSSDNSFEEELNIAQDIQKGNLPGLAKIENIQLKLFDKLFQKYYCLNILTEHPSYNLREYLQKKAKDNFLAPQQIIDLSIAIVNAQYKLGSKTQFLGFENIFTSDGEIWKIKPFIETKSFYQELYEQKQKNSKQFEMSGFPSPEEFHQSHCDSDRVQIFGFGMLLLQLITQKQSKDIYQNFKINESLLADRINLLRQKTQHNKNFIEIVQDMLDLDIVRRPNYQQLYSKLNSGSFIGSRVVDQDIKPIDQNKASKIHLFSNINQSDPEVFIKEAVSKIEQSISSKLHEHKIRSSKSVLNSNQNTKILTYYGDMENEKYHGVGKLYTQKNQLLYDGQFNQGQYHDFGTLYYFDTEILKKEFPYEDLTNIDKYAERYEGSFQNGKKHGEGKLILTNQEFFTGSFVNDVIDGYGAFQRRNFQKIYGKWKNAKFIRDNLQSFQNQDNNQPYEGISKLNTERSQQLQTQFLGYETATQNSLSNINQETEQRIYYDDLKTKIKYQGEILQGMKNGKGKLYFENGKLQYEGDFVNDQFQGFGTQYNEHPIIHHQINYTQFREVQEKGYWKLYKGTFQDGKKNGYGSWYFTDNNEFIGLFENDLPHGEGILTRANREEFIADWEEGVLLKVKKGKL